MAASRSRVLRCWGTLLLLLAAALYCRAARAQVVSGGSPPAPKATSLLDDWPPPTPRYRLLATSILGASFNPEGIEEQVRIGGQMLLYRSKSAAFRDNFVFVGLNPRVNPVAGRFGPEIEI